MTYKPDEPFNEWLPKALKSAIPLTDEDSIRKALDGHYGITIYWVAWQENPDSPVYLLGQLEDTSESIAISALKDEKYPAICREFSVKEDPDKPWVSTIGSAGMAERYLTRKPGRWLVTECDWCRRSGSAIADIMEFINTPWPKQST